MSKNTLLNPEQLDRQSTEELKQQLLQFVRDKDFQPLKQKVRFYEERLEPIVNELSRRNPYPKAEDQLSIILGVWTPVWSTIPFQDALPGRSPEQSYQIFHKVLDLDLIILPSIYLLLLACSIATSC